MQPRRRPYDSASAVPSKVAFKVEQIPIATTKTEEVESEEAAPDENTVEEGAKKGRKVKRAKKRRKETTFQRSSPPLLAIVSL